MFGSTLSNHGIAHGLSPRNKPCISTQIWLASLSIGPNLSPSVTCVPGFRGKERRAPFAALLFDHAAIAAELSEPSAKAVKASSVFVSSCKVVTRSFCASFNPSSPAQRARVP